MSSRSPTAERTEVLAEIDAEHLPHQLPSNNWRSTALRLAVSLGFLAVLFWRLPDVSLGDVLPELTAAAFAWVAVAVGVHVVAYVLQTVRWSTVSDDARHPPARSDACSRTCSPASSCRTPCPTSFGGDVVRVVRQGQDTGDFADAFAATALERLTGWLVLPLLSTVALAVADPDLLQLGTATTVAVITNVVTVVGTGRHPVGARATSGWRAASSAPVDGGATWPRCTWASSPSATTRGGCWGCSAPASGFQFLQCVSVYCRRPGAAAAARSPCSRPWRSSRPPPIAPERAVGTGRPGGARGRVRAVLRRARRARRERHRAGPAGVLGLHRRQPRRRPQLRARPASAALAAAAPGRPDDPDPQG